MKKNTTTKIKLLVTLLIVTITALSIEIDTFSKNDVLDDTGGWLNTFEKDSSQTWPEYWQAFIDNPYGSPRAKVIAEWVIANGYSNSDFITGRDAYLAAHPSESIASSNNTSSTANNSHNSTNSASSNSNQSIDSKTEQSTVYALTEGDYGIYVVTSKKAIYSAYTSDKNEIGSLSKGTEVEVTGNTSNGYYQFTYTNEDGETVDAYLLYKNKDNIVDKETYDAAWSETSNVAATCTNDGYIEYTNSLSGLTRREEIKASGHVLGDEELTKEPGLFTKGEIVTHCAVCGEIIETRALDSYLPIWSLGVVAILIIGIVSAIIIKKKKINK